MLKKIEKETRKKQTNDNNDASALKRNKRPGERFNGCFAILCVHPIQLQLIDCNTTVFFGKGLLIFQLLSMSMHRSLKKSANVQCFKKNIATMSNVSTLYCSAIVESAPCFQGGTFGESRFSCHHAQRAKERSLSTTV